MALNDRKGGVVARIRVNPRDCLAVVDIMERLKLNPYQHSFSGCVSIALASLIGMARKMGAIPEEEDGFQYLNRVGPFLGQANTKIKRERTNQLYEQAQRGVESPELRTPERVMEEYLILKERVQTGQLEPTDLRFLELQSILF